MAKGQQRSNREAKKPKKDKPAATGDSVTSTFAKGALSPAGASKKKK